MSVQPGPTFKRYAANGVATVYAIPFLLLDAADLQITLNGALVTTGFTLSGIGSPTSSCTFSVPPTGDLLFQMVLTFQRLADYQTNGDFLAITVNRDYDRLWLAIKQLSRDNTRGLTASLLEPEGIPSLPAKAARALKMLAFDANGDPITSNLTLAQLEQQPALALDSAAAAAASAVASGESAAASSGSAAASAGSASAAAASAASVAGAAVFLHSVQWWNGPRSAIPAGYGPADGQLLSRALYPDAWAGVNAGNVVVVSDAAWLSTPSFRGCYSLGNGTSTFRLPDLNGVSSGAIGAPFLRGDGALSAGSLGTIRASQNLAHTHSVYGTDNTQYNTGIIASPGLITTGNSGIGGGVTVATHVLSSGGSEARPTDACGCFIIKLFGAVTNQGAADAALLATEVATLASRCTVLESTYVSANQAWAIAGTVTASHGLSARPIRTAVEAECVTADAGYAVGAVIDLGAHQCLINGANSYGFSTEISNTQLIMNIAAQGLAVVNKSTKVVVAMTPASWRLRLKASKS